MQLNIPLKLELKEHNPSALTQITVFPLKVLCIMRQQTRGKSQAFIPLLSGEGGELPQKLRLEERLSI